MLRQLDSAALIAALEALGPPGLLAFDADGTLWRGDVGEDVFLHAIQQGFLKQDIAPALRGLAQAAGLSPEGDAAQLCLTLLQAYHADTFDERAVCEVMTWCYAGHTRDAVAEFAQQRLRQNSDGRLPLAERYNAGVTAVIDWARRRGCRTVIVSASPKVILEVAAAPLGFAPDDIVGASAAMHAGVLQPKMQGAVPYGPDKARLGRELLGGGPWLASFGDSPFDIDMLRSAKLAVGVQPKPPLLEALSALGSACQLI